MKSRLHKRIRDALINSRHLKQKDLAERLCISPAAVNRLMHGRRYIKAEEIPIIEDYLGISLALDSSVRSRAHKSHQGDVSGPEQQDPRLLPPLIPAPVPVYRLDGAAFDPANAVDWAPRHPVQLGSRTAFAVYAETEDMAPRYFRGEIVYIHPGRPALPGHDVLLVPETGAPFLARLVRETHGVMRVALFNPAVEKEISRPSLRAVHAVVGRG